MHVSVTGISHHETPISLRELYAFGRDELGEALSRLPDVIDGGAILSTCNRTELYLTTSTPTDRDDAVAALARSRNEQTPEGLVFYHYEGDKAVRHLFRVAAGIESLVVGESEILGQVRESFSASTAAGRSNPVLARLFHSALRAGRRVRSETEIGAHGLSVSAIAVSLSRGALGSLAHKTVLVVGAGEAGQRAAAALVQSGAARLLVTTRTFSRAEEIAGELNGLALPFEQLPSAIAEADVVISATAAPEAVISAADAAIAMASRPQRPLVMVDIAVPRDVEPAARQVPGVHLYDIDDLQALAERNRDVRLGEVTAAEAIIEDETQRFLSWLSGRDVQPAIAALNRRAESIRRAELDRTLAQLGKDLSDADRQRIEAMSRALVKRLLHSPVTRLREGSESHLDAVRDLFDLYE